MAAPVPPSASDAVRGGDGADGDEFDDAFDDESPPFPARRTRTTKRRALTPVRVAAAIVAALAVALVLVGLWRAAPNRNLVVATSSSIGPVTGARPLPGVVVAVRTGHRVCFSVDAGRRRTFVIVPKGWTADSDLRLLDPLGRVRLLGGTRALLLGRPGPRERPAGCSVTGPTWLTADVRAEPR